jgi:hypothetical protein
LYRIKTVKEMSERQSEASQVQKMFKSAGAGQELCPQSSKELQAATTAILQFARLRLDGVPLKTIKSAQPEFWANSGGISVSRATWGSNGQKLSNNILLSGRTYSP